MACYNSSAFLDEAINSVLAQTFGDLELILVDDCSTDNTLDIARRYQLQDSRVSVLELPVNNGPSHARNIGFQHAAGEWFGILDSDDVAMPSRFREQMMLADNDKDLVMIGSNYISIDKDGNFIREHAYPTSHSALVRCLSFMRGFPPHSSMVYKRDAIQKLSGFNKHYPPAEDKDLWLRLSEIGKIASVNMPLARIRKHDHNISNWEGFRLQYRLGLAATVCHFLRIQGYSDPSAMNDDSGWLKFIKWVDSQMIEKSIFERRAVWSDARVRYFAAANRLTGTLRVCARLLQSGYAGILLWENLFGSSLPQLLAREWIKQSCSIPKLRTGK